jgi:hypothetical protein
MQFLEEVKIIIEIFQLIVAALALVVAIVALFVALYIPRKVMVNQLYANLETEYRSPEMGAAILALLHFFVKECNGDIKTINDKYHEKYKKQIKKHLKKGNKSFSNTLHFQRRRVAQFYYSLARLRFDYGRCGLSNVDLKMWFTQNETKLLSVLLHLAKPASSVFIKTEIIPPPPQEQDEEVHMNKMLYKLYKETKKF